MRTLFSYVCFLALGLLLARKEDTSLPNPNSDVMKFQNVLCIIILSIFTSRLSLYDHSFPSKRYHGSLIYGTKLYLYTTAFT